MSKCKQRTGLDDGPPLPSLAARERAAKRIEEKYPIPPSAPEVLEVLQRYVFAYPAFRIKPVGAPGSEKRIEQENLMALEDAAQELIRRSRIKWADENP